MNAAFDLVDAQAGYLYPMTSHFLLFSQAVLYARPFSFCVTLTPVKVYPFQPVDDLGRQSYKDVMI